MNAQFGAQCSTQVVLSPITKEKKRNTVVVFAEEVRSKQIIPCDVDVDVIDSLQVVTRTRELYVEEAPQRFEVSAYDDQGNSSFSQLQSITYLLIITVLGVLHFHMLHFFDCCNCNVLYLFQNSFICFMIF